ncbi:helix-turn-helix domain-containing protein [Pedobacter sp. AW1-32]|uniref:helix-turn-helix domain-containing protein n=1 Tax=Pedobacter sp. AW1-32 TaxID=3383026 RepID=UPI003FED5D8C
MKQHSSNNRIPKNIEEKFKLNEDLNVTKHDGPSTNICGNRTFRPVSFALILITDGKTVLKTDLNPDNLKTRDLVFLFPGSVYEFGELTTVSFFRIGFKKSYLKKQSILLNSAENYRIFQSKSIRKFSLTEEEYNDILANILCLEKRLALPKGISHINEIIRNSFLEVLYDLFLINNKRNGFEPVKHDRKAEITGRFLNMLTDQFRKEKRVQHYADALFITSRHLSQVVKEVTGKTASEIIIEMVIREAKILLTGHILNVSEVSEALSFSNASFFGKYFKKYTGISPSEYRSGNKIAQPPIFQ